MRAIAGSDGSDEVVIYVEQPKAIRRLGARYSVSCGEPLLSRLWEIFGKDNVLERVAKGQ